MLRTTFLTAVLAVTWCTPIAAQITSHRHGASRDPATAGGVDTTTGLCRLLTFDPAVLARGGRRVGETASPLLRLIEEGPRTLVVEVGPVDLPAGAVGEPMDVLSIQLAYVPFDLWVHRFELEVVDRSGRPVPRILLHHLNTSLPARRDLFLPVAQRFLAFGRDTPTASAPGWLLGAPLYGGEPLLVNTMFHNPTDTSYEGVRLRVKLTYTRAEPWLEARGFRLDVMFPTGAMEFDLPPGETVRRWDGSPVIPVRVMAVTAHAHRYVKWIELRDVTTGERLWRLDPRTTAAGELRTSPIKWFVLGLGKRLEPQHRYRISARYLNPTRDTIRRGGMAKIAGVFRLAGQPLPPIDPADPLYREDLRHLLRERCDPGATGRRPHIH